MKRLFVFILSSLYLVSCTAHYVENILNDVETYISERPDSALAVLDSIDRDLLTTRKHRSHHALLHVMALDKNFVDVSDDSLALEALNYYDSHGDKRYKARSLYYLGLSYYYSGQYDKAILEFTKAEEVAQKHDSLYLGMTKIAQADTYAMTYNDVEEYNNTQEAYDIFSKSPYEYYKQVSKVRLAVILIDVGSISEADALLEELINSVSTYKIVKQRALSASAYIRAVFKKDYNSSVEIYERMYKEYNEYAFGIRDYWVWAYSLHNIGRSEESSEIVSQLQETDTSIVSSYWMYILSKDKLDYKSALYHLEKTSDKSETEVASALKQELSLKQRDYYSAQSELASYRMRYRTWILIGFIIFSLLILGYVIIFFLRRVRMQQQERERYMEYVAEITRQLAEVRKEGNGSLKRKYLDLYKSKFEVLRTLSDQYLQTEDRVDAEKIMYRKVVSLVNEIRNDQEHRIRFESMLDSDLDGIMTNIRTELPKLKEIDYAIFSYWIIGFDVTTISRLLDTSLNIVYIRKTRIKQHIREKSPEHMDQFLEMIS